MATARDPWPSRSSILRFTLDAIFLSGSLNSFKDPQLVLKTQVGPLPRVPYTGNRSRVPVTRHVLMVHVKDKANELVSCVFRTSLGLLSDMENRKPSTWMPLSHLRALLPPTFILASSICHPIILSYSNMQKERQG